MTSRSFIPLAFFSLLACLLTGCGSGQVVGKVLPGAISYVGVVDQSDERLAQMGLKGVTIRVEAAPTAGSATPIATATSKPDGSFKLSIPTSSWPTDRVQIRATADGYATARGSVYLPHAGQSLLILLERTAAE